MLTRKMDDGFLLVMSYGGDRGFCYGNACAGICNVRENRLEL